MAKNGKSGVLLTVIFGVILLIIAGVIFKSFNDRDHKVQLTVIENQKQYYTGVINSRDSLINETMNTFNLIEKELGMVKEKERVISVNSSDREFTKTQRDRILKDISYLNNLLDQNKNKIASLSGQLKKYGVEIQGLKDKIAQLENDLQQRKTEIEDLKGVLSKKEVEITTLNSKVDEQQSTITNNNEVIANKTFELHKGFVAYGTHKDLIDKGIISKEGGFLGIGQKQVFHFSDKLFRQVDITEVKTIPVNSKNFKLATNHSAGSYELKYDKTGKIVSYIEITNPNEFWKASKYAIIEIK